MNRYVIIYADDAVKELRSIPKKQVERIIYKIEALAENPLPVGTKKLRGKLDLWRIRVGDYRVVYSIEKKILQIEIIRVKHRKDVYDQL